MYNNTFTIVKHSSPTSNTDNTTNVTTAIMTDINPAYGEIHKTSNTTSTVVYDTVMNNNN